MSEIVLASSDEAFEGAIRSAFDNSLNGELLRVDHLSVDRVLAEEPAVVALGPSWSSHELIEAAAEIDRRRPENTVVLFAEPTADLWQQALRSGARDLIDPGSDPTALRETIERARERSTLQRSNVRAEVAAEVPADLGGSRTRIVAVVSPKGGSGKTVTATNLAMLLAQRHDPARVCIVDADLQFGDVCLVLQPADAGGHSEQTDHIDATAVRGGNQVATLQQQIH